MDALLESLHFDAHGLIPAIAQNASDGRILMLAWMNREAFLKTVETGYAHYWSRSRKRLWKKGETSGHVQRVLELRLDCDGDALLLIVDQSGPACHTGQESCFFRKNENGRWVESPLSHAGVLAALSDCIQARKRANEKESYVASLMKRPDKMLAKIGEEAAELIVAAKEGQREAIVHEAADLCFHTLVTLAYHDLCAEDVLRELSSRFGISGHKEKASRSKG